MMFSFLCTWIFVVLVTFVNSSPCYLKENGGHVMHTEDRPNGNSSIFHDSKFWHDFVELVQSKKAWKCGFPPELLLDNIDKDAKLYKDDTVLRQRRLKAVPWIENDSLWITTMLGACKELADGRVSQYSMELRKYHMLEALSDFVEHLNCFYLVAKAMATRGVNVTPMSQDASHMHDIDKLDPVMLVGYSERFEDNKSTSVWDACVDRHTHVNPHHQAHCIWNDCCTHENAAVFCERTRNAALREMICDKVSRRVQKNLNGVIGEGMWDVDINFFDGLPEEWLGKAVDMMQSLKNHENGAAESCRLN